MSLCKFVKDCRTNKAYVSNGTAACDCWSKAAIGISQEKKGFMIISGIILIIGIEIAKQKGCKAVDTAKDVKAAKNKCIKAFQVCKKAEDAAVGLIHTCMAGDVKNISASGRLVF